MATTNETIQITLEQAFDLFKQMTAIMQLYYDAFVTKSTRDISSTRDSSIATDTTHAQYNLYDQGRYAGAGYDINHYHDTLKHTREWDSFRLENARNNAANIQIAQMALLKQMGALDENVLAKTKDVAQILAKGDEAGQTTTEFATERQGKMESETDTIKTKLNYMMQQFNEMMSSLNLDKIKG